MNTYRRLMVLPTDGNSLYAEAHTKSLVVRRAVGAGLPLAGVGCAIRRDALEALSVVRGGAPFDESSLVEDYESGLEIAKLGYSGCLARVVDRPGGELIATRAYFPETLATAVRQKARWITGIALAGWDRTGWGRPLALTDHWMRARDRRAPIAVVVLAAGYLSLFLWLLSAAVHVVSGTEPVPLGPLLDRLLLINAGLLGWRTACRVAFTWRLYGRVEGFRAVPRLIVGNLVDLLAMARAVRCYGAMAQGTPPVWDKTAHHFPDLRHETA
jgi:adsorption protein B